MPELPEVEIIRRGLEKYLVGSKIADVEVRLKKQFIGDPKDVVGAEIIGVRRFGKGLVIDMNNGLSLVIHLKMTGQLIYNSNTASSKHTRIIFYFDKDARLYFNDIRKFGWIKIVRTDEADGMSFFKTLGLEPLKDLTLEGFVEIVKKGKLSIKALIMDQRKIAGIGNIYANEALFEAKIDPKRKGSNLKPEEIKALFKAIEKVLRKGIEAGGASDRNYVNALGMRGSFQNFFKVYRRDGKECGRCGSKIEKMRIGGRGTFFCGRCQV